MSTEETPKPHTDNAPVKKGLLRYRRKLAWLALVLLLYTLGGFFLVPIVLNHLIVDKVRQDLGREASFEKIHFNPFHLALKVNGFKFIDSDGELLAQYDQLFVNFQGSSLFKWTWTFREISLDGAQLNYERFTPQDSRLSRLLNDIQASSQQTDTSEEGQKGLPRLLIQDLHFRQGSLRFKDHVPVDPVALDIGPVNISVQELNTLPDRNGQQTVAIRFPGDASLEWQGSIGLAPLHSEGHLTISNAQLDPAIAYLKAIMPLQSIAARLSINTDYRLTGLADGGVDFELDGMQLELTEIAVSGLTPSTDFFSLRKLALSDGQFRFPEKQLSFNSAEIDRPSVTVWLSEARKFSLLDLVPKPSGSDSELGSTQPSRTPWSFAIDQLRLSDGQVHFTDRGLSAPVPVSLSGLTLTTGGISNNEGDRIALSLSGQLDPGGTFNLEGEAEILPLPSFKGKAEFSDVSLLLAEPYLQQRSALSIDAGSASAQIDISKIPDTPLSLTGSTIVTGLNVMDTRSDENLLAWQQLEVDRFEWVAGENSIQLSLLSFDQPYGRFRINEDRTTNFSGLFTSGQPGEAKPDPKSRPAVVVGGIGINNGVLDFSDLSLPLQFAAKISDLDGSISTIDTSSAEPANIRLEGQVDEYGLARIEGSMAIFDPIGHTNISVEFRNLMMSNLSPYTVKFAGREIDEGKLELDLGYSIEKGRLEAENRLELSDLALGREVESPDAVSLPLDLAVALLKDSDGIIKLELPVTGDVNSPEFEISGVVMQAIANLLTKIVTAPFRMLGSLIGLDSEDLGQFRFLAGRADLTPPELEKIVQLQTALQQRPDLVVEISGPFNPAIDRPKLQYFKLRDEVLKRLGKQADNEEEEIEMLDDEIRSILEDIFSERFPQSSLETMKDSHRDESSELDALAYAGELKDRLLASENITTADLESLATARAGAIREAFLADGGFSEDRLKLAASAQVDSEDGEWVATELGIVTD